MSWWNEGKVTVAGAGGFIGGHLVAELLDRGADVRGVDVKPLAEWHQVFGDAENVRADLRHEQDAQDVVRDSSTIVNLAADMGGMGFIENNRSLCMLSVLINTHLLQAAKDQDVSRYFFASSACVYPAGRQRDPDLVALAEDDVYPAMPEEGYGWEKLFAEHLCRYFREDFGVATHMARYHNVYGPEGTWRGGREKAPAAICRKVAEALLSGVHEMEIWGDGSQTRSFTYISDCVEGTIRILETGYPDPLNIGSSELVTINGLVDLVEEIAGTSLQRRYVLDAPQGVRGRNSDNSRVREVLGWEPSTQLRDGLERTYRWVHDQVAAELALR
jgi:GDP-D-mannose 3', 5'-epimerase